MTTLTLFDAPCKLFAMASVWEKVRAENIVRHAGSGKYYLQAKVGGKKIRRCLHTADLRIAKIKRDTALAPLRAALPSGADAIKTIGDAVAVIETRETSKAHLKPRTVGYYGELFVRLKKSLPLSISAMKASLDVKPFRFACWAMRAIVSGGRESTMESSPSIIWRRTT